MSAYSTAAPVVSKILYPDGVTFDTWGMAKDIRSYVEAITILDSGYEALVTPETCQRLIAHYIQAGWPVYSNRITL